MHDFFYLFVKIVLLGHLPLPKRMIPDSTTLTFMLELMPEKGAPSLLEVDFNCKIDGAVKENRITVAVSTAPSVVSWCFMNDTECLDNYT